MARRRPVPARRARRRALFALLAVSLLTVAVIAMPVLDDTKERIVYRTRSEPVEIEVLTDANEIILVDPDGTKSLRCPLERDELGQVHLDIETCTDG